MTSIKLSNKPLKVYSSSCIGIRDHEDLAKMQKHFTIPPGSIIG